MSISSFNIVNDNRYGINIKCNNPHRKKTNKRNLNKLLTLDTICVIDQCRSDQYFNIVTKFTLSNTVHYKTHNF